MLSQLPRPDLSQHWRYPSIAISWSHNTTLSQQNPSDSITQSPSKNRCCFYKIRHWEPAHESWKVVSTCSGSQGERACHVVVSLKDIDMNDCANHAQHIRLPKAIQFFPSRFAMKMQFCPAQSQKTCQQCHCSAAGISRFQEVLSSSKPENVPAMPLLGCWDFKISRNHYC